MGNELIISIGRQLNIPGKVDNEWMCRVIYSIAGQMGLASLWDYDEDEDTVSIQHFKERIAEIFAAYEELYPSIKFIFPEKISHLSAKWILLSFRLSNFTCCAIVCDI